MPFGLHVNSLDNKENWSADLGRQFTNKVGYEAFL